MKGYVSKMGYSFIPKIGGLGDHNVPDYNTNPSCIKIQEHIQKNPPVFPYHSLLTSDDEKDLTRMLSDLVSQSCEANVLNPNDFIEKYNKIRDDWLTHQEEVVDFLSGIEEKGKDQTVPTTTNWRNTWDRIYNRVNEKLRSNTFYRQGTVPPS